jgi:hypothetical protein
MVICFILNVGCKVLGWRVRRLEGWRFAGWRFLETI